jgi:hypothetical protein
MTTFAPLLLFHAFLIQLSGCTTTPPQQAMPSSRVAEVTRLIKCELFGALKDRMDYQGPDGSQPFLFLGAWGAKGHLTLTVDDSSGVASGVTLNFPRPSSDMFSLGLGAGLGTEAIRTEEMEFFIYFPDLFAEFSKLYATHEGSEICGAPSGEFLESGLGLVQFMRNTLIPVEVGYLSPSKTVSPADHSVPALGNASLLAMAKSLRNMPPVADWLEPNTAQSFDEHVGRLGLTNKTVQGQFATPFNFGDELTTPMDKIANQDKKQAAIDTAKRLSIDKTAIEVETRAQAIIANIVKPLYSIAAASLPVACMNTQKEGEKITRYGITDLQFSAITEAANVSVNVMKAHDAKTVKGAEKALQDARASYTGSSNAASAMISSIQACKRAPAAHEPPKLHDPVDTLTETVTFNLIYSGSVSPAWKLVRVSAPNAALLSASRKQTSTLILVMGRPEEKAGKGPEASLAMTNQLLAALINRP